MSHVCHTALPGYDEHQILHDGCPECEHRGKDVVAALIHLDVGNFERAWRRAYDLEASGGDRSAIKVSRTEKPLLEVLWFMQVQLERQGFPLNGAVPVAPNRLFSKTA
jgi:hypothetical protein